MTGRQAALVLLWCALALQSRAAGADEADFVVRDFRVEGLKRHSDGTVYNYLPINIGDRLDRQRLTEAFRALYSSNFFDDLEFRRDGDTLVIVVKERPTIAGFDLSGNKDIRSEDLLEAMRDANLAPGRSFDPSVLDSVSQFLTQQYFEQGKYGVQVDTSVTELSDNRVNVKVEIKEGERARIRQINIVGNSSFEDKELLDEFKLRTPNLLSFYRKDDRYAREALLGDLEALQSFYMDQGFADFRLESTQVAISPNKKDMFITVNLEEGDRYTISEIKLSGEMVVPEQQLLQLVQAKPGQTFSRKLLTQTSELIGFRLGQDGYARARVDPVPMLDREKKEVAVNFFVDPGQRIYVRRINFNGATSINDEVFRREMRQLEGGYLSNIAVERSEQRIRRLPFVEKVQVDEVPVPGSEDLVDVEFEIDEGLPGQFGGGIGFSGTQGIILNGNFTHTNFMGTGNRVAAQINAGRFSTIYSLSHTNPYFTPEGKSLSLGLSYRDTKQFISGSSDFSTQTLGASFEFGVPISEYGVLRYGISFQDADLLTGTFSAEQAREFVRNNGNPFTVSDNVFGSEFYTYELFAGWSRDTRDRFIFARRGTRQSLSLSITGPGSEVEYYVARYEYQKYWPLWGNWALRWNVELGYGQPLADTTDLPPFRNFFGGGPESVRGYENGHLGPLDSFNNPYGGNIKAISQLELLLPTPERFANNTRIAMFYDLGNIFYDGDTRFCVSGDRGASCAFDIDGDGIVDSREVDFGFDLNKLRGSVGLSVEWLAPLGTFRFSYAVPLNEGEFDSTEGFQFSIGQTF